MIEPVEPRVVVEGDLDRAVLRALGFSEVIPREGGVAKGRDAAIRLAADTAKLLGSGPVTLVLDRNGSTEHQLRDEVCGELERRWEEEPRGEGMTFSADGPARVVLVPAGLPDEAVIEELGIERYMMDDYLLCLFFEDEALAAFCEGERQVPHRPESAAELRRLIDETSSLLRERGIKIDTAKRCFDLIRAIMGLQPTRATIAENLVRRSPKELQKKHLGSLEASIREAVAS